MHMHLLAAKPFHTAALTYETILHGDNFIYIMLDHIQVFLLGVKEASSLLPKLQVVCKVSLLF